MGTEEATKRPVLSIVRSLKLSLNPRAQKIAAVPRIKIKTKMAIEKATRFLARTFISIVHRS